MLIVHIAQSADIITAIILVSIFVTIAVKSNNMHTFTFNGEVYATLSLANGRTVYQASAQTTQEAINKVLTDAIAHE